MQSSGYLFMYIGNRKIRHQISKDIKSLSICKCILSNGKWQHGSYLKNKNKNLREVYCFVLVINLICDFLLGNRDSLNKIKITDIPTQRETGVYPFRFFLYAYTCT